MASYSSSLPPPESPENPADNVAYFLELNNAMERMIEETEDLSVRLILLAYDVVDMRTDPELGASLDILEDAFQRCKTAVFGQLN
ncbi:synaptonemal complex central element protein 3 [Boleophthalmus pectinirostris]|uniref:synaptonemal complex central element protein 3 n=1 Tax=Boleophthalmus pectinirostris TaxID=150288 RepID=UPI002432541C|nr:synaptonemal complex central element protein 3 [Boleophthalmus pectinirostris]